jgi:hypothetical protein
MKRLWAFAVLFIAAGHLDAATYYLSPTGTDSGTCTTSARCKTLDYVWTLATAGENNVILGNGVYGYSGMEIDDNIDRGTSWSAFLKIEAENDAGARITLSEAVNLTADANLYLQVEGIIFDTPSQKTIAGHEWKFLRCGFKGGATSGNAKNVSVGDNGEAPGASNFLFEDCFFIGYSTASGRYQLLVFRSENGVIRRGVSWMGDGWDDGVTEDPSSNFVVYNSSHIYSQGFIVLDSTNVPDTYYGSYYVVNNSVTPEYLGDFNHWENILAVNNAEQGIIYDNLASAVSSNTWRNVSVVDSAKGGAVIGGYGANASITFEKFAVFTASHVPTGTSIDGIEGGAGGTQIVKNGIIAGWEDDSDNGVGGTTYIDCFGNGGSGDGGTGQTTVNPRTNGLIYHHRIEAGSTLATAGEGGIILGPDIVDKIGTSGTLKGETGWNTDTGEDLWPWPEQDTIKIHLRMAYSHGFGASTYADKSLTEYVLGYGNSPYEESEVEEGGDEEISGGSAIRGVRLIGVTIQ